jgi:hypothetical protein
VCVGGFCCIEKERNFKHFGMNSVKKNPDSNQRNTELKRLGSNRGRG